MHTHTFHIVFLSPFFLSKTDDWMISYEKSLQDPFNDRPYLCDCGNSYRHSGSLRFHKRWECGKLPSFQCPICKNMFKRRSNMTKHMLRVHNTGLN